MREHDALRVAGGAGGVEDRRRRVGRAARRARALDLVGVLGAVGRAGRDEVVPGRRSGRRPPGASASSSDDVVMLAVSASALRPAGEVVGGLEDDDLGVGLARRRRRPARARACCRSTSASPPRAPPPMSARKCSIRLVAMIATVSPARDAAGDAARRRRRAPSSRVCAQVSVRQASPSGTWCLSEYAGWSPLPRAVSARASAIVRPPTSSLDAGAFGQDVGHGLSWLLWRAGHSGPNGRVRWVTGCRTCSRQRGSDVRCRASGR